MFDYANNPIDDEEDDENDAGPGEMLKTNLTSETVNDVKAHSTRTTVALSQEE